MGTSTRCAGWIFIIRSGKPAFRPWCGYHGGGLTGGRREIPEALKDKGLAVVGVEYRLSPTVKVADCVDDAAAAAAWVVKHIASYGGDPGRVFVAGHSAGGYLTLMIGLDKRWLEPYGIDPDTAFVALIPYSGQVVTHFERRRELGLPDTQPLVDDMAPLSYVRPDCRPMLILSGDREREMLGRYEENAYFWRMMRVAGHPDVRICEFDGFDHGQHAAGRAFRRGALYPGNGAENGSVVAGRTGMKMNRHTLCMAAAALLAAFALTGCSLLKVAVATGDPLSKEEMNIRTMTRGFYYDMASEVSRTADSIAAAAPDIATRAAAVRWKIRATRAGVSAAMQGIPDVALADMWILCRRMDERFAAAPDSLLFGAQSDLARDAAARLDRRAARLARQVLAADRYGLMERFVADYVRENPADGEMEGSNTTLAWIEFLRANGIEHAYATGSIAEVLSDVNDRVSGQTQQLANSVGWSKDLIAMQLQQDSMRMEVGARLDSLERNFTRIVVVAEHLPEISDKVLEELNEQVTQLIYTMNYSLDNAFANFDRQRDELQRYVTAERQALVDQLRESADGVVQRTLDAVPGLVGKVLLYVVLALVVLVGGPFALGFWLGGVRERARRKREKSA